MQAQRKDRIPAEKEVETGATPLHVVVRKPESAAGPRNEADTAPGFDSAKWAALGVLALLFLASVAYIAFGGEFETCTSALCFV